MSRAVRSTIAPRVPQHALAGIQDIVPCMQDLARRLDAWLAIHAPAIHASLMPPAPDKGGPWARLEGELGFTVPEDFRALYAVHNGQREKRPGVFDGLPWLSLDRVLERYRDDDGELGADAWPDAWVPFAGDATDTLVVDFGEAPAPVLRVDADGVPEQLAATLRGYVAAVVTGAEAGKRHVVDKRGLVLASVE